MNFTLPWQTCKHVNFMCCHVAMRHVTHYVWFCNTNNSRGITLGAEDSDDLGLELLVTHGTREGSFDHGIKFSIEFLLGMSSTFLVHALDSGLGSLRTEGSGGAGELTRGGDGTGTRHGDRLEGRC